MAEQDKSAGSAGPVGPVESKSGMPQADVDFLIACLKNTTGGSISIDTKAVADALKYQNHRSVGNRISALKKKYDLPFGSSSNGKGKASDAAGPNESAIPVTPNKNRVTKPKTPGTGSARKKAASKKVKKEEPKSEDEEAVTTSAANSIAGFAVKNPGLGLDVPLDEDEALFGTADEGEDEKHSDGEA
ncbi:uncharacterized protein BP5553_08369 [Venustampulla echinocandica]|uniref:Myb-like DNA-binding domain-containing protein n=1 Tax=Venustampulla echinocandica TaxID=2656787 RepID=A0A370TGI2_9HELO|nr:uncharacterized protein BP5553_08369 [Venustampulla echinocandica]RDL34001.1 hypothetical protein BP5553_08369 [Venustampulla echinocandica]